MKTRPMYRGKIIFIATEKATGDAHAWGHVLPQHLAVRIFARGVTQGSQKMTVDAPVIPRSKLLKSGRTIGDA